MRTSLTRGLLSVLLVLGAAPLALATTIVKPVAAPLFESEYGGRNAIYSFNAAGLDFDLTTGQAAPGIYPGHSNDPNSRMWHSSVPVATTWIVYDLGANYLLSGAHIWNFNEVNLLTRQAKDITLSFSTTAPNSGFGTPFAYTLLQTAGANGYQGETTSLGEIVEARYVRVDILTHYTTSDDYTGLSEIRFLAPDPGVLAETPADATTIAARGFQPFDTLTLTDAITLENVGGADTAVQVTGFSITGPDAAQFDLSDFATAILGDGESVEFDLEFTALASDGPYSAMLTIFTDVGNVTYELYANAVPEPSTLALFGLGGVGLARQARRRPRRR